MTRLKIYEVVLTRGPLYNGLLRDYIPKGTSIERYSDEDVLSIADELNQRPRRILGYHTPAELFDHFLDEVHAIDKCS